MTQFEAIYDNAYLTGEGDNTQIVHEQVPVVCVDVLDPDRNGGVNALCWLQAGTEYTKSATEFETKQVKTVYGLSNVNVPKYVQCKVVSQGEWLTVNINLIKPVNLCAKNPKFV